MGMMLLASVAYVPENGSIPLPDPTPLRERVEGRMRETGALLLTVGQSWRGGPTVVLLPVGVEEGAPWE